MTQQRNVDRHEVFEVNCFSCDYKYHYELVTYKVRNSTDVTYTRGV